MQYAIITIENQRILLDAREHHYIMNDIELSYSPLIEDEEKTHLYMCYGDLYLREDQTFEDFIKYKDAAHFLGCDKLINMPLFGIVDYEIIEKRKDNLYSCAWLIEMREDDFKIGYTPETGTICFENMDILTTFLNRPYLIAFQAIEKRVKQLSKDNWKNFIDRVRAIKCSKKIWKH